MNSLPTNDSAFRVAPFILYATVIVSLMMVLFPPYTSLTGTERAFILVGPEWSRRMSSVAQELGLQARLDWTLLLAQLATLWALSLGAVHFLARRRSPSRPIAFGIAAVAIMLTVLAGSASAQANDPASPLSSDATVGIQGGKYGVGFASSWPSYGLSGTLQLNETITAEALVGFLGTLSNFGGKVWYRFNRNTNYDLYGYGTVSMLRYKYTTFDTQLRRIRETESVLGIGAGAGIEAGIQTLFKDDTLPPIFLNWEIGLSMASFDYFDYSAFIFGGGIHYRFGAR
ncbi:MAG TPA: hypothetical protein VF190_01900 [Rhodothermales bacterium]